jgi:restriction endonuclease S subunit
MITATHKGKYYDVEYSIVNVSELEGELRIDAEYYDPFYINFLDKKLLEKNTKFFGELIKLMTRNPMAYGFKYVKKGIPFIRIDDLFNPIIDYSNVAMITEEVHKKLKTTQVEYNDILMGVRGNTIGRLGIYKGISKKANISPNVIIFRFKNPQIADYMAIYLLTKFGRLQIERILAGTGQPTVTTDTLKSLKIPIPSDTFQKFIEKLVLKAYEERQKAEQFYKEAEEILLEELGLKNWKPKSKKIKIGGREFEEEENISIRMLSEVIKTDRMDAEYWEPKYDEIEELIKKYRGGYDYLPNLIDISKKKIKVNKDEIYSYIELADINPNLGVVNQTKHIKGKDLPSRARMKVEKGYVIMSSVEGSIDKIALIDFEKKNLVASTGFFVFKEKELNKETLLVLLKILAKKYIIREAQGTILTAIPYDSLSRIVLPRVEPQIQQKISQLIQQSFKAKENSKKLLEIAKKTVEIYIEKDEEEGLNYATNKLKELNIKVD